MVRATLTLFLVPILLLCGCAAPRQPADLVLINGKIVTVDPDNPEVRALAARDGRIVALGSDDEIRAFVGDTTRVIDLEDRLALPGFIESHGHFTGLGRSFLNLGLSGAKSWEEIVSMVADAAKQAEPGEWILGWGWHQEKWDTPPPVEIEGYPTHDLLSAAVPNNPVLLKHAAGNHAGLANALALNLAGIAADTPDPDGGTILHFADGRPTGVLREKAYQLALAAHKAYQEARTDEVRKSQARREVELADRECLSRGVTSFQDAGSNFATVDLLKNMAEAGEIGVRLWVMLRDEIDVLEERIDDYRIEGAGGDRLTVRAIKYAIDGALGSHGAWLLEPYVDLPETSGLNTAPLDELQRAAELAIDHGFQFAVHAIGDRGNREILDIYERVFRDHPDRKDPRWRIEHAQHLHPDDIPRFAELGVIAAMQGVHCTSDGPWVPERIGPDRAAEGAYVWRKLIDSGAVVTNGTDVPIESIDPIANFHASITRRMNNGESFYPDQVMTRMEALRSYTIDAAYAAFEDHLKGSLAPGKLADITVLSEDILSVPDERVRDARVVYTIVGGQVLYELTEGENSI